MKFRIVASVVLLSILDTSNYHEKLPKEENPLITGFASWNRCIVIDPTTDTIGVIFKTSFSKA
jgi:hypothetical protein